MLNTFWNRPFSDGLKLGWISRNRTSNNNMPKILNRLLQKDTLLQFGTKTFVTKVLENYTEMGKMGAKQYTEYQDIIQVYDHKAVEKVEKGLTKKKRSDLSDAKKYRGHQTM